MQKLRWSKVTRLSQIVAIVLFVSVFYWGFYLGRQVGLSKILGVETNKAQFVCDENKSIKVLFYKRAVKVTLSNGEEVFLPQTISASGARYSNDDESLVFWNKGNTAFITEGDPNIQTYKNCVIK